MRLSHQPWHNCTLINNKLERDWHKYINYQSFTALSSKQILDLWQSIHGIGGIQIIAVSLYNDFIIYDNNFSDNFLNFFQSCFNFS